MPRKNRNAAHVIRTRPADKPCAEAKAERQVSRGETIRHGGYRNVFQVDTISPGRLVASADWRGGRAI